MKIAVNISLRSLVLADDQPGEKLLSDVENSVATVPRSSHIIPG
jgi:hypothetical protein